MNTVQLRNAKAQLSALVDAAVRGEATTITRHGKPVAVLVSVECAQKIVPAQKPNFAEWLLSIPHPIPFKRDRRPMRKVKF